ncbi:MAG: hypothetical protein ACAI35_10970, partial [Candidatus Methylacidiphilales bacterium]
LIGTSASAGKIQILPQAVKILRFGPEPNPNGPATSGPGGEEAGEGDGSAEDEDLAAMAEEAPVPQQALRRAIRH